jgi:hypothetical protein
VEKGIFCLSFSFPRVEGCCYTSESVERDLLSLVMGLNSGTGAGGFDYLHSTANLKYGLAPESIDTG